MKVKFISSAFLISLSLAAGSQTKKIAFESHSGNLEYFDKIINSEFFDGGESNYGLPSTKSRYKLDSVIYINDSASLIVSNIYTAPFFSKSDNDYKYSGARKDTLFNYPLLTRQTSSDSIRKGIIKLFEGGIVTETSSTTVFIGFDPKPRKKQLQQPKRKKQFTSVIWDNRPADHSPLDKQLWLILGAIMILSVGGGFLTWKLHKSKPAFA